MNPPVMMTRFGGNLLAAAFANGANKVIKDEYDAVVVASGHYNDPFIPDIPGLVDFDKAYPGAISHSKFYRRPNDFKDKVRMLVRPTER